MNSVVADGQQLREDRGKRKPDGDNIYHKGSVSIHSVDIRGTHTGKCKPRNPMD